MAKFGIINYLNELVVADNVIYGKNNTTIINPTEQEYLDNGYKYLEYSEALPYKEGFNIEKYYEETDDHIYVKYRYMENIEENYNIEENF